MKGVRAVCVVLLMLLGPVLVAVDGIDLLMRDPGRPSPEFSIPGEDPIVTSPFADGGSVGPSFTENRGQFGQWPAKYYAMGRPLSVAFGEGWIAYSLQEGNGDVSRSGSVIRVSFEGAADASPEGRGTLGHVKNYLRGREPSGWITGVPNYGRMVYPDLWEGIDMAFHFAEGELKYEFTVAPGADPSSIVMVYEGMDTMEVNEETGDLLLRAAGLDMRDRAPVSMQRVDGDRVEVATEFRQLGGGRVGFDVDQHDPDLALTIDPGMMFCTFLGESGDDEGFDVAIDQEGHAYVAGVTTSSKFPLTAGAYDTSLVSIEAFVSKFSPDGSTLEYSTFIGGDQNDTAAAIAVDLDGNVLLVGTTNSTDFPTTAGAFCTTLPGSHDTFALKLNVTGASLEYSTYIGGSGFEMTKGADVDSSGSVFITGRTDSTDFPTVEGSYRRSFNGTDIYVVKLRADGSDLDYSVLIGGSRTDIPNDIAVDWAGRAYITGETNSEDYPIVSGAVGPWFGSRSYMYTDAFVTKLNITGTSLVYSTYIGHWYDDVGIGIDVDGEGCAYVVGTTKSVYFPTVPSDGAGPPGSELRASWGAFILKLQASGRYMDYSRVLTSSSTYKATAVAVDDEGCLYVTGIDNGTGVQTTPDAFQPMNLGGEGDAYVLKFTADGEEVLYGSYLGGNGKDYGNAVVLDGNETAFITGKSYSTDGFPTTPGVYDNTSDASTSGVPLGDAFLCRLDLSYPYLVNDTSNLTPTTGESYTFNFTIGDNIGITEAGMHYWFEGGNGTNLTLDLTQGNRRIGAWTATIEIPGYSLAPLYYRVWAKDAVGFNFTIRDHSVAVVDNDLPFFENLTPVIGGTGNTLNLSVRVADNIGVSKVAAIHPLGGLLNLGTGSVMTSVDVTNTGNGTYNFSIVLPWYSTDPIEYRFWANDTSGNPNMTALFEIKVVDDDGSRLAVDPFPHEVITGQELDLRVYVRDNIGVASGSFTWWFDVGGDPETTNVSMVARSVDPWGNGYYTATFQVPFAIAFSYAPPLALTFSATDLAGNKVTSGVFVLVVRDDDPPWFLEVIAPEAPTTGDPFDLKVRVWDNIALSNVWVDYWFDKGIIWSLWLSPGDGITWNRTVNIPTSATVISFFFSATDTTGNYNRSARVNIRVEDNDPPVVVTDDTDDVANTSDGITFKVIVEDNFVVDRVTVLYWSGEWGPLAETLVGENLDRRLNGTYKVTLNPPFGLNSSLTYMIETRDGSGNVATTEERSVRIIDDDPPSFEADLSDLQAWRGEMFNFNAEVWDTVGVDALRCEWWFGEGGHADESVPLNSSLAIVIPLDPVGPLRYFFTVLDTSGNQFITDVFEREVLNMPPILAGLEVWSVLEEEHEELDLRLFIEDRDDSAWDLTLESPDPRVTLEGYILRVHHDVEILDYTISISVTDGRETSWHDVTVHVVGVNDPPLIYEMRFNGLLVDYTDLHFTFREGEDDVLTVDAEDEEWEPMVYTWWRNDRQVASGQILRYRDLPTGEYALTLNIDDGSDVTSVTIHVTVTEKEPLYSPWLWIVLVVLVVVAVADLIVRRHVGHDD